MQKKLTLAEFVDLFQQQSRAIEDLEEAVGEHEARISGLEQRSALAEEPEVAVPVTSLYEKYQKLGDDLRQSMVHGCYMAKTITDVYSEFIDRKEKDELGRVKDYTFSKEDAKGFRKKLRAALAERMGLKSDEQVYGKRFAAVVSETSIQCVTGLSLDALQDAVENEWVDPAAIAGLAGAVQRRTTQIYEHSVLASIKEKHLPEVQKYLSSEFEKRGWKLTAPALTLDKAHELFTQIHKGTFSEAYARKNKSLLERIGEEEKKEEKKKGKK